MGAGPVRSSAWNAGSRWAQAAQYEPIEAAMQSVRIFNRELGRLLRLRKDASQNGEVVTRSNIELSYEKRGGVMVARDGETIFDSKEPGPSVQDRARQMQA